jgi:hypothetical protein
MKRTIVTSIGLLVFTAHAFALDPLGPPVASLNETQPSAGLEYLYSEMDLHADSLTVETPLGNLQFPSTEIQAVNMNKLYANLTSTLLGENFDVYLRLGLADASPDKGKNRDNLAGYLGDSDYGFIFGGGFRTTLHQSRDGKTKWGLLAQLSYASLDFARETYSVNGSDISLSATVDMLEMQLAAGPTYQVTDNLSIYGGPFLHLVKGEAEVRGSVSDIPVQGSSDLKQGSELGGFIGLSTDLAKNTNFNIEFQLTDDAQAIGLRFIHRF